MAKAGKVANPADKARKEARKKELKKNKKQRSQVRSAVIESKDPEQIVSELDKLDRLEYNVETNPEMSDVMYKDKRKRLRDTLTKILAYYLKEDPERHETLKKLEDQYESRHRKLLKEFESVKAAKELKIEEIFLPPEPTNNILPEIADDDPLMSESVFITPFTDGAKPPGCPPGLPPDLKVVVESLNSSLPQAQALSGVVGINPQLLSASTSARNTRGFQRDKKHYELDTKRPPIKESSSKAVMVSKVAPAPVKVTVIESKPIMFKPKTTAFVPASVRSKLGSTKK